MSKKPITGTRPKATREPEEQRDMPRRSKRTNKGYPPPHLANYLSDDTPLPKTRSISTPMPKSNPALQFSQDLSNVTQSNTIKPEGQFDKTMMETFMKSILEQVTAINLETVNEVKENLFHLENRLNKNETEMNMLRNQGDFQPQEQPAPVTRSQPQTEVLQSMPVQQQTQPQVPPVHPQAQTQPTQPGLEQSIFTNPIPQFNQSSAQGLQTRRKLHDLPVFSGNADEWPMFIASFTETNIAYGYSNLENLIRLQRSLQGEARQVVQAMLIHAENIPYIIDELQFRFGRTDLLVKSQIAKLKKIPLMRDDDLSQLISFSTTVRNLVVFLRGAQAEQHLLNPMLIEELVGKLSMSRRLEWARYVSVLGTAPDATHFAMWISDIARIASIIEGTVSGVPKQPTRKFTLHVNDENRAKSINCVHCDKEHEIQTCSEFANLTVPERWIVVKKNHICFCCLKKGHRVQNCRSKKRCNVDNCELKHNSLLHEMKQEQPQPTTTPVLSLKQAETNVYFCIVPITLINNDKKVDVYALIDHGSSVSFMESSLANDLNMKGEADTIQIQWLEDTTVTKSTTVVNCIIQGRQRMARRLQLKNVRTMTDLQLPYQSLDFTALKKKYPQLNDVPMEDYSNIKPRILIGLDNARLGYPRRWIDCYPAGPLAVESDIGWYIYGPDQSVKQKVNTVKMLLVKSHHQVELDAKYEELNQIVQDYCELENLGVQKPLVELESEADKRARQLLKDTTKFCDGRYETGLLWKKDAIVMPDSFQMALNRFKSLERKMQKDLKYGKEYHKGMSDFIQKKYARKLTPEEAAVVTEKVWYLPHFAVSNPNKPDKLRIVFDAAATVNKTSLNSQLLKGPDLNQPLMSVLSRFREKPIAVCGDIREMFCQIRIRKQDCPSQRFLYHESEKDHTVAVYEMDSMTFGATCSPTSAQYIKNINAQRFVDQYPEAVDAIVRSHYVDDYVISFNNEEEAVRITAQVKAIHEQGGFDLRNFISNSVEVNEHFMDKHKLQVTSLNMNVESMVNSEKILGLYWHSESDNFAFEFKFHRVPKEILSQSRPPTKREVLCLTMSLFDPFGFIANYTVTAKILLQEIWGEECDWDQSVPENLSRKWYQWQNQLDIIKQVKIPRCYSSYISAAQDLEIHTFVDASESAFAAVSYWRFDTLEGVKVVFVQAKTRVAPRKPLTIPRLELQAAVLGVRLTKSILDNHDIQPTRRFYHTDSSTVKYWIKSDVRNYKQFVAHRISEILDESCAEEWRWIPTSMNPADEATRASLSSEDKNNDRWLTGPEFLYRPMEEWPNQPDNNEQVDVAQERKKVCHIMIARKSNSMMIDLNRFSKYRKAKRTIAWALRVFQRSNERARGELSSIEEDQAELYLCRGVQQQAFPEEYYRLSEGKKIDCSSSLYSLSPYMEIDGLIRIEGRIDAASTVPFDTRRPIILPKKQPLTRLIIAYYHEQMHHQNFETVICQVRQKFWVPALRNELKYVIKNCQWCKIVKAKPNQPQMGQLPIDRLTPYVQPFTYTGLDYFGPIEVTIGRRREKRWVALFTCLTYRAVHLELASNLSTDACLLCIRSFVSIRGRPIRMRSDNGTNFVGIKKELANVTNFFDQERMQSELSGLGIQWIFNSPSDPSAGGAWERLVQSVKRILNTTLQDRTPREDTLRTLLAEAANIVNSRPLTHIPVSPEDEEPITPNHFLLGKINSIHTPIELSEKYVYSRKQWEMLQQLRSHFYKRWVDEYLPMLTRRCKWFEKIRPVKEGELVIVCDSNVPRSQWPKGRVVRTYSAKDGQIRSADIKIGSGILRRPVNKLAILDVEVNPGRLTEGGMSPTTGEHL